MRQDGRAKITVDFFIPEDVYEGTITDVMDQFSRELDQTGRSFIIMGYEGAKERPER